MQPAIPPRRFPPPAVAILGTALLATSVASTGCARGAFGDSASTPVALTSYGGPPPPPAASLLALSSTPGWPASPRLAVHARVSSHDGNVAIKNALIHRSRAVLDAHRELTTDLQRASELGLPVVNLDASASCRVEQVTRHLELGCVLRFAVSNDRGLLLAAWQRSVHVDGAVGETRGQLLAQALDHAVHELPERLLASLGDIQLASLWPATSL